MWTGVPSAEGAHWLRYKITGRSTPDGVEFTCEKWAYFGVSATDDAAYVAEHYEYIGPCLSGDI